MKKMKWKEIDKSEKVFEHEKKVNNEMGKATRKALEEEDTHQVSNVKDAVGTNPVIMLECERSAWAEFKTYA